MRLTLRTMLAYLDGNLEPDDAEDIGKKIDESEFATTLVQRIREVMRRERMGVPALLERGLAADPNTVAEYLEYRLDDDRVPEFEKICLASDVHLSEVASCHQILTLVLGEPAEIDPAARERMYALAAQVDEPPVQATLVSPARVSVTPPPVQMPVMPRRPKPEVPEYLRERRSPLWPVAALVLVVATLTFGALVLVGPGEIRQRVAGLFVGGADENEAAADAQAAEAADPAAGEPATNSEPQPRTEAVPTERVPAAVEEPAPVTDVVSDVAQDPVAPEEASEVVEEPAADMPAEDMAPEDVTPESAVASPSPAIVAPGRPPQDDSQAPPAPEPQEPVNAVGANLPDNSPRPLASGAEAMPAERPGLPAVAPGEAGVAEGAAGGEVAANFGRFTSKRGEVLLKLEPASGDWKRLRSMAPLAKGDRLMSLPSFRPLMTLASNITVQADGPAMFELAGWTDQGLPILEVQYGRLLMLTVGKPHNTIQLRIGGEEIPLTFVDADSSLALDVHFELSPGADPEAAPATPVAQMYVTSGQVRVREGRGPAEVAAGGQLTLLPSAADQPEETEFPQWVTSDSVSDLERRATIDLEPLLEPEQPVVLVLKELANEQRALSRKREVRSLAVRSLCYLGDFDACVAALNDGNEERNWPIYIDQLRLAVARSPETARQVRSTLERRRGEAARELYRMLWGYSAADLEGGSSQDLVNGLDNESLDYRVLSFWNLQQITGPATHGYRPKDPTAKRRTPFNAWKEKLRQGKIVPKPVATGPKAKPAAGKAGVSG